MQRGYTTHMNPSRSPLQKYHLASCFCEKVKRLEGFFCDGRLQGSRWSSRSPLETPVKLKASQVCDSSQLKSKVLKMQKGRFYFFLQRRLTCCQPWLRYLAILWQLISGCHYLLQTCTKMQTQCDKMCCVSSSGCIGLIRGSNWKDKLSVPYKTGWLVNRCGYAMLSTQNEWA